MPAITEARKCAVQGFILAVDARQKAKTPLARCGSARLLFLQARGN